MTEHKQPSDSARAGTQTQFLNVIDRDEAERRFREALRLGPLGEEEIPLSQALGRVTSRDAVAEVDVPSFDRSNFDGFAVRAEDVQGAEEEHPRRLRLLEEIVATGMQPTSEITPGTALTIATGAMTPRGADAVVMVEFTDFRDGELWISKPAAAGFGISFTGSDVAAGETVVHQGERLTSRETGVLAAVGMDRAWVYRRPKAAVISTGNEIIAPGEPMRPGMVYDSNAQILADAVEELGGIPLRMGIVNDDKQALEDAIRQALQEADAVILSGGTSKGAGDLSYRVVEELTEPGVVAHGVALKPGKPVCLASHHGKPVVILPGFPTSAVFTFHEFVAPVLRELGGRPAETVETLDAELAVKINSVVGRTEYALVGLIESEDGRPRAYPMGKGSGSVTTFSRADGFVTIPRRTEIVESGAPVV
ncbi:MAG: molybdopterin-binding protein, partial [Planctomycetales bacterium]